MIDITRSPIDLDRILAEVDAPESGGVVVFIGRVRNHAQGRPVIRMEYEGYEPMARRVLQDLENDVRSRWPVEKMAIVHRLGTLEIGDASVVIAVACAHRAQAFEACRYTIDRLKQTLPVWKKEFGPDGASWVEGVMPDVHNAEEDTNL